MTRSEGPSGRIENATHFFDCRVYYEDTDAAGIVYYANYLRFLERARTECLRLAGIPHSGIISDHGVLFAVRRCEIDYLSPARLDDALEVATRILEIRGASMDIAQEVRCRGTLLVTGKVRLACITTAGRPARIPVVVAQVLSSLAGGSGSAEQDGKPWSKR
jgi:acyl-CoA thioester hydrolase